MPLPKPKKNEKQNDFISRCMSNDVMKKEFPNNKQRVAVCYSNFSRTKKGAKEEVEKLNKLEQQFKKVSQLEDLQQ